MPYRLRTRFVTAVLLLILLGTATMPSTLAQVVIPPEGTNYNPWPYRDCAPGDGSVPLFTCTWFIQSGTRTREEHEERACYVGWSHRKATQPVVTTIVESYETYRIDVVESSWSMTGGTLLSFTYKDVVHEISRLEDVGECRPVTGRPPQN